MLVQTVAANDFAKLDEESKNQDHKSDDPYDEEDEEMGIQVPKNEV